MMRGKSPPSDVEMSKTEFIGGRLGFLAAILDCQLVLDKLVLYINHLYQFWYVYHKVNYLDILEQVLKTVSTPRAELSGADDVNKRREWEGRGTQKKNSPQKLSFFSKALLTQIMSNFDSLFMHIQ